MSKLFVPLNYQEQICADLKSHISFGLFSFPGSGKTAMILDMIYKYKQPTLVICPLPILYTTWLNEHSKWSQFETLKIKVLHDQGKDVEFLQKGGLYLINPEGIPWLFEKIKNSKRFPFVNLVIDESIRFKNPKSKRFKLLCKFLKLFKRRFVMCGNPIPNGYLDLWSQIFILDFGKRLETSWNKYRDKYFWATDYRRWNWELKPGAKEEILRRISDITTFLEEEDTDLKLPERMEDQIIYDLSSEHRTLYNQMEKKLFGTLDEGYELANEGMDQKVLASTRATALGKCRQIAQGFLYENYTEVVDGKEKNFRKIHDLHRTLSELCVELVDELSGKPVVIVYWYEQDFVHLYDAFKDRPKTEIMPRDSEPQYIQKIERAWNNNELEVLICHINKLSHGLNLQYGIGHHVFLYALTYNYDTYDQLIRRFQRQGASYNTVFVKQFVCKNTVHGSMIESLTRKEREADDFFKMLRVYKSQKENRSIE